MRRSLGAPQQGGASDPLASPQDPWARMGATSVVHKASKFFSVGGTLDPNSASYIERLADTELYDALLDGEYVFILDSRQKGKSSLIARVVARLRAASVSVVKVDLQRLGSQVTPEQWYAGILHAISLDLGCVDLVFEAWFKGAEFGAMKRWMDALDALVQSLPGPIVVVLDEVDFVRSLPFSVDELFAGIRACFNARADDAAYRNLTFGLVGVATPAQLIRSVEITPFNVGRRIELADFARGDLSRYEEQLNAGGLPGALILDRAYYWVAGHPYLTQLLCDAAIKGRFATADQVDELVHATFVKPQTSVREPHLADVERRLLEPFGHGLSLEEARSALLDVYGRMIRYGSVPFVAEDTVCDNLTLAGVAMTRVGTLVPRNRLYSTVFDRRWIRANLPDAEVRRQRRAARKTAVQVGSTACAVMLVFGLLTTNIWRLSRERGTAIANLKRIARESRQIAYNASILSVDRFTESGNWASVREGLEKTRDSEFRGWEWNYLNSQVWSAVDETTVSSSAFGGFATFDSKGDPILVSLDGVRDWSGQYVARGSTRGWQASALRHLLTNPTEFVRRHGLVAPRAYSGLEVPSNWNLLIPSSTGRFGIARNREGQFCLVGSPEPIPIPVTGGLPPCGFTHDDKVVVIAKSVPGFESEGCVALEPMSGRTLWKRSDLSATALCVSHDDKWVAIGGEGTPLTIIEAHSGRTTAQWETKHGSVAAMEFSPNDSALAVGYADGTVQIFNTRQRTMIGELRGLPAGLTSVTFRDDARALLAATSTGIARLYTLPPATSRRAVFLGQEELQCLAVSNDGTRLAVSGHKGTVTLLKFPAMTPIAAYRTGNPSSRSIIAFTADSCRLAISYTSGAVEVVNASTGQLVDRLAGLSSEIKEMSWQPGGSCLAASTLTGEIRIWHVDQSGRSTTVLTARSPSKASALAIGWSQNGQSFAWTDITGHVELWTVNGTRPSKLKQSEILQTASETSPWIGDCSIRDLAFTPDGRGLCLVTFHRLIRLAVPSLDLQFAVAGHADRIQNLEISHDGGRVITQSMDMTVRIWNAADGSPVTQLRHDGWIAAAHYSPDGRRIATASSDKLTRIWDSDTGDLLSILREAKATSFDARWSPDGRYLVTVSTDGHVRLYDSEIPLREEGESEKLPVKR